MPTDTSYAGLFDALRRRCWGEMGGGAVSEKAIPMESAISGDPFAVLSARMDRLEREIKSALGIAEDAARDAQDAADDIERLERDICDLEHDVPGADDDPLRDLRDEIRYLMQRMDRLEIAQRSRSMAS